MDFARVNGWAGLVFTGFIQVFFVSINIYFLSRENYVGVTLASFMVSLVWSFNVKRIAFGSSVDRIIYAAGATAGSLFGLWSSRWIDAIINLFN